MATAAPRKTVATARKTVSRPPARKTAPAAAAAAPAARQPTPKDQPSRPRASGDGARKRDDSSKKVKLVRDSFTLPKLEYGMLQVLKTRASHLGRPTKKSEIVRAGIKALLAMNDADFMALVGSLAATKTPHHDKH